MTTDTLLTEAAAELDSAAGLHGVLTQRGRKCMDLARQLRECEAAGKAEGLDALLTDEMLEVGRKAIEDTLIEWRDERLSELMRNNGFVIKEADGTPSDIIRFGPEVGLSIGIKAMRAALATKPGDGESRG